MDQQSAFSKKKLQTINIEKSDWMEELNLPPELIKFLRGNAKALQIGGIVVLLLLIAYGGFEFFHNKRHQNSTAFLAQAVKIQDLQERKAKLQEVVDKYSGTDAGLWARIDLAHLSYDQGQFDDAITFFSQALKKADSDNSAIPLIEYGLANAYEQKKDFADAKDYFARLAAFKSFEREGSLGIARIEEKQGDLAAALQSYEKVLTLDGKKEGGDNAWLEEKVHSLKASQSAPDQKKAAASE